LQSATLPEYNNDTMDYTYDDLGNLLTKSMGTYNESMSYDGLGRLQARTVTFNSRSVHYTFQYDTQNLTGPEDFSSGLFTRGRLVRDTVEYPFRDVTIERYFRYHPRGWLEQKTEQFIEGVAPAETTEVFHTRYTRFDSAGHLLEMKYPSGKTVNFEYQTGGRLGNVGLGDLPLCTGLAHHAGGAAAAMTLHDWRGGTVNWVQTLNSRQWPERIMVGPGASENSWPDQQLFGLWYKSDPTDKDYEDNGNIIRTRRFWRQDATAEVNFALFEYAYDPLNRLRQFEADVEGANYDRRYDYTMDEFGNVTRREAFFLDGQPTNQSLDLPVNIATNRLLNRAHDGLGNMMDVGPNTDVDRQTMNWWDQGHAAQFYDSEDEIIWDYFYDADGKRRLKARDVYGEVDLEGDASFYFYEGEDLICQLDRGLEIQDPTAYESRFLLLDHLGTTRAELQFEKDGATTQPVINATYDYMPYGDILSEWHTGANPPGEQVLFTGKQRDTESGKDYFGTRYYSGSLLRWNSPDELFADSQMIGPQSWNLYRYARNNPVKTIDSNGKENEITTQDILEDQNIQELYGDKAVERNQQQRSMGRLLAGGLALLAGATVYFSPSVSALAVPAYNFLTRASNSPIAQDTVQTVMEIAGGGDAPPTAAGAAVDAIEAGSKKLIGSVDDLFESATYIKQIKQGKEFSLKGFGSADEIFSA